MLQSLSILECDTDTAKHASGSNFTLEWNQFESKETENQNETASNKDNNTLQSVSLFSSYSFVHHVWRQTELTMYF